jgi:Zn-dependent protease with chaperone function
VIEQLRTLVPGWVEWLGPLVFVAASVILVWLLPMVPVRVAARRIHPSDHWTRRARYVHAARSALLVAGLVVPAAILMLSMFTVGPPARVPGWLLGGAGVVVATLAIAWQSWRFEQEIGQPMPGWSKFLKGYCIRVGPGAAVFLLAVTAPEQPADPQMAVWLGMAIGIGLALRYQLELLCRLGLGRQAGESITAMVERAAQPVGVETPQAFIVDHHQPNAFAFPWTGKVAFTGRAVEELSAEELESVALHELGHMAETPSASAVRQATHFVWVPVVLAKPILLTYGSIGILALIVIFIGLLVAVRWFARTMEARSDAHVAEHDGSAPYGRALEKVYRIGLIPAVLHRPSHGQLQERLEKAGLASDFDPPAPPPRTGSLVSIALIAVLGSALLMAPYLLVIGAHPESPLPAQVALAFGTYGSWPYERLGELAEFDGNYGSAEVFYAAGVAESTDPDLLMDLVYVRSQLGRCDEAAAVMDDLLTAGAAPEDVEIASEFVEWCEAGRGNGL